jgi:hypothetical protein
VTERSESEAIATSVVIPVNKVVDKKRIIGKKKGRGGGKAQGVADLTKDFLDSPIVIMDNKR